MGRKLSNRIDTWKKLLLDFGKRNRLINFKEGKRNNVAITEPGCYSIYDSIVVEERELTFPYVTMNSLIDDENTPVLEECIKGDFETTTTVGELQKTLKVIRHKAHLSIEEQGINTLFLTFGMLKWKEMKDAPQVLASPLVLVPVKLAIESLTSPYRVAAHEDEIVVNPTLRYKLEHDYNIILPDFDGLHDSLEEYLAKVEEVVGNEGWKVDRSVNLTNLSFLKINMYKDLERNEVKLNNNTIVSAIAGEGQYESQSESLKDYDHDECASPIDTFQVVDADSSQQDAILLSKRGESFVLQGPPGTGKSQTITNIISEALADGKKVLFVSEKMAALQVVHSRLDAVGLADFCITLHSHKANKKAILRELESSINVDRKRVKEDALMQLDTLERKRKELNEYEEQLHTPCSSLNMTVFEVNGKLAMLDGVKDFIFPIANVTNTTQEQLNERNYLLGKLADICTNGINNFADNCWRGTTVSSLSNEMRHDIDAKMGTTLPMLQELNVFSAEVCDMLGIEWRNSVSSMPGLLQLLQLVAKSQLKPLHWACGKDTNELMSLATFDENQHDTVNKAVAQILQKFDREVLSLDYYPILQRYRSEYTSFFRIFKSGYRRDSRLLKSYLSDGGSLSYSEGLKLLQTLKLIADNSLKIEKCAAQYAERYAQLYNGLETDWNVIKQTIGYVEEIDNFAQQANLSSEHLCNKCCDREVVESCRAALATLTANYETAKPGLEWCLALFEKSEGLCDMEFGEMIERLADCKENKDKLEEWIDYRTYMSKCKEVGLGLYLEAIESEGLESAQIVTAYQKRFYTLWLDAVIPSLPAVQTFRSKNHLKTIEEFCDLDRYQFMVARARVRERVLSRMPEFDSITAARDEISVLKRELGKQRRIMPLRKLLTAIPNLITTLRPCFMMSPLSVSVFLEADSYNFDLVIFDEASQVHTEDAIGAIMRGKQVIIVGDTQQLPPTNFFTSTLNEGDYDVEQEGDEDEKYEGTYESILNEMVSIVPEQSLRWHYRSRHEHLIAFSNLKIYNGSLITFPSAVETAPDLGVEYIHVSDGIYDRGGKRYNIKEAERVVDLVFEHIEKYPFRSLGVVTFSEAQQFAVDHAIRQRRCENRSYEFFFSEEREESFFIKNLENVQGDERDTIIFSIGYAKDANGVMQMNFGPLSKEGGYRRLNVAITRAKYNVKLVGSILPTDIDLDKTSSEGVKLLRAYIEFAQQGMIVLDREAANDSVPYFDSSFEESIYNFLQSEGFDVETQVGCSGYRIGMAVKHPTVDGKFAIGIECDGTAYHASRTARERDRLRQTVLEGMGWTLYRVWSTDWVKEPKVEKEKLVAAVREAIEKSAAPLSEDDGSADDGDAIDLKDIEENVERGESSGGYEFVPYEVTDVLSLMSLDPALAVQKVIETEQPIHIDELCRRVALVFGREKKTTYVEDEVEKILRSKRVRKMKRSKDGYIALEEFSDMKVRKQDGDAYFRKIEYVCEAELVMALLTIAQRSCGITPEDLFFVTARELGYKRSGDNITKRLKEVYDKMIKHKALREVDGKVQVLQSSLISKYV